MKNLIPMICLIFLSAITVNGIGQITQRQHINFDDGWKFAFGHAGDPAKDFNYSISNIFSKTKMAKETAIDPKFNDSNWRSLNLPHDWAVELPFDSTDNFDVMSHGFKPVGGLFPETSVGWYRKHFSIAKMESRERFQLQFDGIFRDAEIWLNGFYLGNNKSGYVGQVYDVTDFVDREGDNVITVRVDATQYEGWFYEGAGIYRHVWLNTYNDLHIAHDGVFVYTKIGTGKATVFVETTIANEGAEAKSFTLRQTITDRAGNSKATVKPIVVMVGANESKVIKQQVEINQPKLWSVETPYLYRIIPTIKKGELVIDSKTIRFGIRTIDVKPNGVFVNGKHVKLLGTNNHHDHAGVGSALPDQLQYHRIHLLKQMGVNAYRTSHNAATPELLDACDSLGMLVMEEQRLLNSSPEYVNQFERIIIRDRSRPSIFMWSIGNEEGWVHTNDFGKRIALSLLAVQKKLDPTRSSTYAADVANVYKGINEVIPVRSFNYRQFAVADYHKDHPLQPIIGTEMGSTVTTRGIYEKDSVRAYVPDQDITAPWWASTAEEWWKLAAPNDFWLGGFIWTGFDYRGEPTPYVWPNVNSHFGVMDVCGFPKNIYYYYKSWWTDKDVLHISPHWNWPGKEGKPIDVWVNSNADDVELFLNEKSLGKKMMPRNGHLQWSVPYEAGTLAAVGFKKGKKITAKVETTGAAAEVVVTPYKTTLLADGKDVSVINIGAFDKQGKAVPDANHLIKFRVYGDAKIIGVGNGDPSSHEPDKYLDDTLWQRRLFNGKCQVILQAGTSIDKIHFEATADGLWKGETDIHTIIAGKPHDVSKVKNPFAISPSKSKPVDKMLGADISFLPELEAKGMKFSDKGIEKDAIQILKDHGFNYVRLRIFNNPAADSGYSPGKGFCDLAHTLAMAKRVKTAGMKLLLDFHYSDFWADPGKQYKPSAWKEMNFTDLKKAVYDYTKMVMEQLKAQGTPPDMVQVGNEINHGMIWPDGHIGNLDSLAQLEFAGINGVRAVSPSATILLHVALGGQVDEAAFFIDAMLERGVPFDAIGLSYYPKWHGTLGDLDYSLNTLAKKYDKDVIVVEYSHLKKEVNDIAFGVDDGRGKGTCIWEPLSTWEKIFERDGKSNDLINIYDGLAKEYLRK